jgi:alkanesulfonate monooxygenase SsuD/methylene tetrahydromethanopterin reductase-like flavin-dependent oxidoreductase (luciferase family)
VADGTILSEPSAAAYIEWARERIGASRPHRLTVYAWFSMDADRAAARGALRPLLAQRLLDGGPQVEQLGIAGEVAELAARGLDHLSAEMPDNWIDRMTVAGTAADCAAAIRALGAAGADAVVLIPPAPGADPEGLARELRTSPIFRRAGPSTRPTSP